MENMNEKVQISGGSADPPEKMLAERLGADVLCVDYEDNGVIAINENINERLREHARTVLGIDLPADDSEFWDTIPWLEVPKSPV